MQIIRAILLIAGLCFLVVGMNFLWGIYSPWVESYLFGTALMSYAIAIFWIGATQSYKALIGGGLATAFTFGAAGISLLQMGVPYGEISLSIAFLGLWYFFIGLKVSAKKSDRMPSSTQWLLGLVFTVTLFEGIYLVIPIPTYFPWILTPEHAIIYGWILIGCSLFFGWGLLHPTWENGYPQLYTIVVSDLLLIGPLFSLLRSTSVTIVPLFLWGAIIFTLGSGIWAVIELIRRVFDRKAIA